MVFIQEHHNQLSTINEISHGFCSVSVSGMDSESLLVGRPFGGCSILYRKSLLSSVSPVVTCSSRFCAVKIVDSNAISYLVVCVYMPGYINSSSHLDYLNTIGELQGFLDVQNYVLIIIGDFNVDFDRRGPLASLLLVFMADNHLVASDLSYRSAVSFT